MSKASAPTRSNCRRNFAKVAAFHWAVAEWSAALMPLQRVTAWNAEENLALLYVERRCGLKPALHSGGSLGFGYLERRRYFATRGIELENNLHIPLHGDALPD